MRLVETVSVPTTARAEVLYRRDRIQACTFTTINFSPVVVNESFEVTIFADHRDDLEAAKDRLQRTIASTDAWALSGGRPETFAVCATPISALPAPGGVYYEDLFEGPMEELDLTNSVLPLLDPLDALERKLQANVSRDQNYESDRQRYKNLCAAELDYLTNSLKSHPPPAKERVLIVRELRTAPPVTHREVANKFPDEVLDVIFMRRGNADLTMRPSAFVVFASAEAATHAKSVIPECELPKDFNFFNDCLKRRLLILQSIVEEVPLSGSGLRGSGRSNVRHAIVQRHRALEEQRAARAQEPDLRAVPPALAEAAAIAERQPADTDCEMVDVHADQRGEQALKDAFQMVDVHMDEPAEQAPNLEDESGFRNDEENVDEFVHVGLIREEAYPDYGDDDWADPENDVPYQAPTHVQADTSGFKWALHCAYLQRYAPRKLSEGKKARHTEHEYVQITERAFWRVLDILWAKKSFTKDMKLILQENDKKFGRNNYATLVSGRRPTGRFNPYKCSDPSVLTVPHWYKTLKYIHTAEGLQQTMDYIAALREFEWIALDTEGGGKSDRYAPCEPCETIQFATKKESFVVDAHLCNVNVPKSLFRAFLELLFTRGARFGFEFDQADREKVMATVKGDSDEARACRKVIRDSKVYDVRRVVERAYEEEDAANEVSGPDRRPPGLPEYVRKKPRLSHYVHHVMKQKFNKFKTYTFVSHSFTSLN